MANTGIKAGTNLSNFDVDRVTVRASGFSGWGYSGETITSGTFDFNQPWK